MNTVKIIEKNHLSVKTQTLAAIAAIAAAVALPQLCHALGAITGGGTALGEALLPMHLPIILVGLLAGPYSGAIAGIFAPLVSFALSGMPLVTLIPFMTIELCVYGLCAGILKSVKIPAIAKVLTVQIAGRLVRAGAILLSVFAFGNESISITIIWTSIGAGILGIALQLVLIPIILKCVEKIRS